VLPVAAVERITSCSPDRCTDLRVTKRNGVHDLLALDVGLKTPGVFQYNMTPAGVNHFHHLSPL
jgi:hypothetical protein